MQTKQIIWTDIIEDDHLKRIDGHVDKFALVANITLCDDQWFLNMLLPLSKQGKRYRVKLASKEQCMHKASEFLRRYVSRLIE